MSERHPTTSHLADIILGGQDGLVNVLGLVLGLVAANSDIRIILAGGLAATFAESISMAAVAFTSKSAQNDHYQAELKRELQEIRSMPTNEKEEIRQIFKAKGFSGQILTDVTEHITTDESLWLKTMMNEELGLIEISKRDIYIQTAVVGLSTLGGSLIPLTPFFGLPVHIALAASLVISAAVLVVVGVYKAHITIGNPVKSAAQMAIIGLGASLVGYLIGLLFRGI